MKKTRNTKNWLYSIAGVLILLFGGQQLDVFDTLFPSENAQIESTVQEGGVTKGNAYSTKDEVAAYLHQFGELPPNYLTKQEAGALGWDNEKGNLWEVTDQMSIGGNKFGNYEGLLPEKDGRIYYEADIDYQGEYRGPKRIVYSNDGLIFYTDDHYESFEQLY
ncbi:MAG: ribonuclease domain-containing protein [Desemzia incerta]|uniref:ribonuclease domain-containing protein n=1 Tax=Desemzia incerta TaxID=82801 RepID=UPI0033160684